MKTTRILALAIMSSIAFGSSAYAGPHAKCNEKASKNALKCSGSVNTNLPAVQLARAYDGCRKVFEALQKICKGICKSEARLNTPKCIKDEEKNLKREASANESPGVRARAIRRCTMVYEAQADQCKAFYPDNAAQSAPGPKP